MSISFNDIITGQRLDGVAVTDGAAVIGATPNGIGEPVAPLISRTNADSTGRSGS